MEFLMNQNVDWVQILACIIAIPLGILLGKYLKKRKLETQKQFENRE